ncbi:MAG TPA: FAD-dependent oxidoreductase, partial [Parafilimonas sp.]|nr:FAD-dependent oxidoreductase [Parafilimonas sp.]
FAYFKYIPEEVAARLPPRSFSHTCDTTDMKQMEGKEILIIGGRQSAYEWAALLNEAGAASVHISHRHPSPAFETPDWSWANAMVDRYENEPTWFRDLALPAKEDIRKKLWAEGRLKLEPWLKERIKKENIRIWPCTQIVSGRQLQNRKLEVLLDNGETITIDHIIFATGYSVNMHNVPFLSNGNILPLLSIQNNCPVLDEHLQTSLPGLFITSMPATHDFGPFFAFTIAVRASAKLIASGLTQGNRK